MESFKEILENFDKTLRTYNPNNYSILQPPLPNQEIDRLLDELRLNHPDIKELFKWKNGAATSNGLSKKDDIFGFGILFPLESILDWTRHYPRDNPRHITIIGDWNGDALLFNNEEGEDYGKIHLFSVSLLSIDDPYSYYDSPYSMLETTIRAYETGIFEYIDEEARLKRDKKRFRLLAKSLNPGSSYWLEA